MYNSHDYSNFDFVNEAYSNFITNLMGVIDKIAPTKEIRIKGNSKAWFDSDISRKNITNLVSKLTLTTLKMSKDR